MVRTKMSLKSTAEPVGLSQLKNASKHVLCPSCGRTSKTIVVNPDGAKSSRSINSDGAVEALIATVLAIATLGLCLCLVPVALQRFVSNSALHYCGHCGLRLAFYSAQDGTSHVFIKGYFSWLVDPQRDRKLLRVASPLGGPPVGMVAETDLHPASLVRQQEALAASGYVDFEVCPWPSFYGVFSLPAVLLRGGDGSEFRIANGGTARGQRPVAYRPSVRKPEPAWRIEAPHASIYFCAGEGKGEEEVARVRVWARQRKAAVYLRGRGSQDSSRWGSTKGQTVEPVSGVGFEFDSSMGPLLWISKEGALALLDSYDRVVAMEVAADEATPSRLSLRVNGNLSNGLVEEIAASYAVRKMQIFRFYEYDCWLVT